jgi:hypothetical protein
VLPDNSLVFRKHFVVVLALDPGANEQNNRNDLEATSFLKAGSNNAGKLSELLPRKGWHPFSARTLTNKQRLVFEERNHKEMNRVLLTFRARPRGGRSPGLNPEAESWCPLGQGTASKPDLFSQPTNRQKFTWNFVTPSFGANSPP